MDSSGFTSIYNGFLLDLYRISLDFHWFGVVRVAFEGLLQDGQGFELTELRASHDSELQRLRDGHEDELGRLVEAYEASEAALRQQMQEEKANVAHFNGFSGHFPSIFIHFQWFSSIFQGIFSGFRRRRTMKSSGSRGRCARRALKLKLSSV